MDAREKFQRPVSEDPDILFPPPGSEILSTADHIVFPPCVGPAEASTASPSQRGTNPGPTSNSPTPAPSYSPDGSDGLEASRRRSDPAARRAARSSPMPPESAVTPR